MANKILPFPSPSPANAPAPGQRHPETPAPVIDLLEARQPALPTTAAEQAPALGLTLNSAEIWSAISEDRIRVHYQPQYRVADGTLVAAEALVRLVDPQGQLVYPDRFIALAEHSDLIVPLGRAVIEQSCADLARLRGQGIALPRVAINLCAHQLSVDTDLPAFVQETLVCNGLTFTDLEFELTERQNLTADSVGTRVLQALARNGSRIVLDDFGMGYSSIACLTLEELPFSAVKLDRALIRNLTEDQTLQSLVKNLLLLASDLGLEVVAEGIETLEVNRCLADLGCQYGQGYGYARPLAFAELEDFLTGSDTERLGGLNG